MDDSFQASINAVVERVAIPDNWEPYRPGVLVTGYNFAGIFGIIGHRGHLFRVGQARKEADSNSGYHQNSRCIICEVDIGEYVDAEWWQRKATREDVMTCLRGIQDTEVRLANARKKLQKALGL